MRHIKSGSIGIINITYSPDTAVPCPLCNSGVTGIDIATAKAVSDG
ncbi:MAG: hypothetical protein ACRC62_33815 [Microcoleus sp.]